MSSAAIEVHPIRVPLTEVECLTRRRVEKCLTPTALENCVRASSNLVCLCNSSVPVMSYVPDKHRVSAGTKVATGRPTHSATGSEIRHPCNNTADSRRCTRDSAGKGSAGSKVRACVGDAPYVERVGGQAASDDDIPRGVQVTGVEAAKSTRRSPYVGACDGSRSVKSSRDAISICEADRSSEGRP